MKNQQTNPLDFLSENEGMLKQFLARTYPDTSPFDLLVELMNEGIIGLETLETLHKRSRKHD